VVLWIRCIECPSPKSDAGCFCACRKIVAETVLAQLNQLPNLSKKEHIVQLLPEGSEIAVKKWLKAIFNASENQDAATPSLDELLANVQQVGDRNQWLILASAYRLAIAATII